MLTAWRGVTGMVVYWDLAALVNGAADYLLLLSAARLAGRTVPRLRLLGAAAFGAAYAVLRLVLPCSPWLTAAAFVGMALLAFRGTGRAFKLGLLTLLLSCALGGGVLLLGQCCGCTTAAICSPIPSPGRAFRSSGRAPCARCCRSARRVT